MKNSISDNIYYYSTYQHRIMICIILSQLILISVFRFWPKQHPKEREFFDFPVREEIVIEETIITRQTGIPASPPVPQVPIPVPNDEIIEDEIDLPELHDLITDAPLPSKNNLSGSGGQGEGISSSPQLPPGIIKIVEPAIPPQAIEANVKAELWVTFLVGTKGEVLDIYINEIKVFEDDLEHYTRVDKIGYGLMEATLEAANNWKFRPARDNGKAVKAYSKQVFRFGF